MEFCFYQENHIWYLAIKDREDNILGKSAFENFFYNSKCIGNRTTIRKSR